MTEIKVLLHPTPLEHFKNTFQIGRESFCGMDSRAFMSLKCCPWFYCRQTQGPITDGLDNVAEFGFIIVTSKRLLDLCRLFQMLDHGNVLEVPFHQFLCLDTKDKCSWSFLTPFRLDWNLSVEWNEGHWCFEILSSIQLQTNSMANLRWPWQSCRISAYHGSQKVAGPLSSILWVFYWIFCRLPEHRVGVIQRVKQYPWRKGIGSRPLLQLFWKLNGLKFGQSKINY